MFESDLIQGVLEVDGVNFECVCESEEVVVEGLGGY